MPANEYRDFSAPGNRVIAPQGAYHSRIAFENAMRLIAGEALLRHLVRNLDEVENDTRDYKLRMISSLNRLLQIQRQVFKSQPASREAREEKRRKDREKYISLLTETFECGIPHGCVPEYRFGLLGEMLFPTTENIYRGEDTIQTSSVEPSAAAAKAAAEFTAWKEFQDVWEEKVEERDGKIFVFDSRGWVRGGLVYEEYF